MSYQLLNRFVEWFTRRRSIGILMIGLGVTLFSSGALIQSIALSINIEDVALITLLENPLTQLVKVILSVVLVIIGIWLSFQEYLDVRKVNSRRRIVCVEFLGMIDATGSQLRDCVPGEKTIARTQMTIDIREDIKLGGFTGLTKALESLSQVRRRLIEQYQDVDRSDISIAVGGIMPVSMLFYAGTMMDDQSSILLMDWNRNLNKWQVLEEVDDGERFIIKGLSKDLSKEVVLKVSVSYQVNKDAIKSCFPSMDSIELFLESPKANNLFSEAKQAALAQQFLNTLSELTNLNVKQIHLVLAAPSSFCLRLGRHYDPKNHPRLTIYEYDKGKSPAYPWGLTMPTYGDVLPKIELMEII